VYILCPPTNQELPKKHHVSKRSAASDRTVHIYFGTFTKSLGVYSDRNLSWNVHVDNLWKKIAAGIEVQKRSGAFVPFDTLQTMYTSLVQPHFDYCSEIWGCCQKNLSTKLQKLRNRAARIFLRARYDTNESVAMAF